MRIDLHTHSTASDGTESPAELIATAASAGLDVVALTDHDTTSGWDAAAAALATVPSSPDLVRGMEMSCRGRGEDGEPVTVHLLAYLFDPGNERFAAERRRLRDERTVRLRSMMELMQAAGYRLDPDAILAAAGPAAGRPHLARALVEAGVVGSVDEAFADLLKTGGRFYRDKEDTELADAVRMIADAGGVSVIAHARARTRGRLLHEDHIHELARSSLLHGLEVDHPDHTPEDAGFLRDIAARYDLIVTGSSDYHGSNKTTPIALRTTAPDQYEKLVQRATGVPVLSGSASAGSERERR